MFLIHKINKFIRCTATDGVVLGFLGNRHNLQPIIISQGKKLANGGAYWLIPEEL